MFLGLFDGIPDVSQSVYDVQSPEYGSYYGSLYVVPYRTFRIICKEVNESRMSYAGVLINVLDVRSSSGHPLNVFYICAVPAASTLGATGRTRQVSCHTAVLVVQVLCAWYKNVVPGVLEDWRLRSHQTGAPSSETPSCMNSVMFASFVLIAMTHLDYDTKTEMIFTGSARELFPIAWS